GKKWSASFSQLVNKAMECAQKSELPLRHGAVLFSNKNRILQTSCNCYGNKICGYDVPSLHAEANCLKSIYSQSRRVGQRYQCGHTKKYREERPFVKREWSSTSSL